MARLTWLWRRDLVRPSSSASLEIPGPLNVANVWKPATATYEPSSWENMVTLPSWSTPRCASRPRMGEGRLLKSSTYWIRPARAKLPKAGPSPFGVPSNRDADARIVFQRV
jgi:hypothetical protein